MTVTRAMNNFFCSIGAAGHHEKRRRNQRPERQLRCSLFGVESAWEDLAGNRYATNFTIAPQSAICSRRGGGANRNERIQGLYQHAQKKMHRIEKLFRAYSRPTRTAILAPPAPGAHFPVIDCARRFSFDS